MSETSNSVTYRSECRDCSWSFEAIDYGIVEQRALSHSETGIHSVKQPRKVRSVETGTDGGQGDG